MSAAIAIDRRDQYSNPRDPHSAKTHRGIQGTWIVRRSSRPFPMAPYDSPFDFKHYVRAKLKLLAQLPADWDDAGSGPVSRTAFLVMYGILSRVADRRTVYPFLSPFQKGGVLAEWRAGSRKVEIEVDAGGCAYVFATDGDEAVILDHELRSGAGSGDEWRLRQALNVLSRVVNEENPGWRKLFDN